MSLITYIVYHEPEEGDVEITHVCHRILEAYQAARVLSLTNDSKRAFVTAMRDDIQIGSRTYDHGNIESAEGELSQ